MDETIIANLDDIDTGDETEPYLIIVAGNHLGKLFNIADRDEVVAGRSPECDIWIEDSTISRKHFLIRKEEKGYIIQDLKSTNGTFVNTKRVETEQIRPGDKIQISKETIIQFDFFDENRKISEQRRYEMGVKDPVTNAYNKSFFLQRISDEFSFSVRQNIPMSILMLDIDFFKMINDTHGHLAGDKVLQHISSVIQGMIRSDDVFCRYGGEEFVIIMRNTGCQAAVNLAERIRRKIEAEQILYDDKIIKVTVSIGVSTVQDNNFRDYVSLIKEADRYLYQSKGGGRNRVSAVCLPQI
ncbi:MAG: GGDEF domain-containing protein [Deltaproteobacteria bacterium]|nr:GGDEF domain-containing protein [Deltaproteobacteria bacterium]